MVTSNSITSEDSRLPESGGSTAALGLPLTSVFRPNCIELIRPATGKSSAISLLIQTLAREERLDRQHAEKIICQLIEREPHSSSAIGKGLAFPHLRTHDVDHFVGAIGVAPEGMNFGSRDQQPTKLVFLTLTPWEHREEHVNLLSRLVRLMQDKVVTMRLNHQIRPQDVYQYLTDLDEQTRMSNRSD